MAYLHREGLATTHVADYHKRPHGVGRYSAVHPTPLPEEAYADNWVTQNALTMLGDLPTGQPWFLAVNFSGPHDPMDVTPAMQERWADATFPLPVDNDQVDTETHQQIRRHYAAMLENIDTNVGRILEQIEARGELDNTVIVYSSDHGEMLGDHNRWTKSVHHQPSVRVPLVVAGPGVRSGVTTDALVALQDLTATFLSSADAPPLPEMDGRSLWPGLRGETDAHRPQVAFALGKWRAVFDGRHKLVARRNGGDADEYLLFDLDDDPYEQLNLADHEQDVVKRLTPLLTASPWA